MKQIEIYASSITVILMALNKLKAAKCCRLFQLFLASLSKVFIVVAI